MTISLTSTFAAPTALYVQVAGVRAILAAGPVKVCIDAGLRNANQILSLYLSNGATCTNAVNHEAWLDDLTFTADAAGCTPLS